MTFVNYYVTHLNKFCDAPKDASSLFNLPWVNSDSAFSAFSMPAWSILDFTCNSNDHGGNFWTVNNIDQNI